MKTFRFFGLLAAAFLPVISPMSVNAANEEQHDDHKQDNVEIVLNYKQLIMAGIQVATITPQYMDKRLYAPGEVQANGYTSYVVSPRVESVIVRRHAILGEHVSNGQALVTLFSEAVAQAQAQYRIAHADWQRAKTVGKSIISESQLLTAETDYIAALSRLKAFGLSEQAIKQVTNSSSSILGEYTLTAERDGAVLSDDFQQGQRVSAGDAIMVLTDETELWVEARLAANNQATLAKGTKAQVFLSGNDYQDGVKTNSYQAQVIQQAHTIDPKTRTRVIRLKVSNPNHQLHPGLFVDVYFSLMTEEPVLVVPETALLRGNDGDWLVYTLSAMHSHNDSHDHESVNPEDSEQTIEVSKTLGQEITTEHSHQHSHSLHSQVNVVNKAKSKKLNYLDLSSQTEISFSAQEVVLGSVFRVYSQASQQWQSWREIKGLDENSNVAITGAFFIASESAKSSFDPHNH